MGKSHLNKCGQGKFVSVQMVTGRAWGEGDTHTVQRAQSPLIFVSVPACASVSAHSEIDSARAAVPFAEVFLSNI